MIVFVRHGQTAANRRGAALGRADPPLTDVGRTQAAAVAAALADHEVARVLTSPLRRARETAARIGEVAGLEVVVDDRLVELDYGEWDERTFDELPADALARWRADPSFAPPGGESLLDVRARVVGLCEELIDGPSMIAVSHVSPIKAAVAWALGVGDEHAWRMFLGLGSISRVEQRGQVPVLVSFNESSHLRPSP